jgi:hypothetical protein
VESLTALYYLVGIGSAFAASMLYLSKQFNSIKSLIYDKHEQLKTFVVNKLDYHEKHDDVRFNGIQNDLWELRLSNARYGVNGKDHKARAHRTENSSGE